MFSSISFQNWMTSSGPMAESERWRSGSTHSTCGWKSRIAASKSRRLYAAMNSRVLSTFNCEMTRAVSR